MSELQLCLPTIKTFNESSYNSLTDKISNAPNFNVTDQTSNQKDDSPQSESQKHRKNAKRQFFTKEEDNQLTKAALSFGQESWNSVAKLVPGKTPKQCRDRWFNYLQPYLNFEPWTDYEDQRLIALVNVLGTHFTKMKNYFSNRSTNAIKNRWYWIEKNSIKYKLEKKKRISSQNNISIKQFQIQNEIREKSNNNNNYYYYGGNNYFQGFNTNHISNINCNGNNNDIICLSQQDNSKNSAEILQNKKNQQNTFINDNNILENKHNKRTNEITSNNNNNNNLNSFFDVFKESESMQFNIEDPFW